MQKTGMIINLHQHQTKLKTLIPLEMDKTLTREELITSEKPVEEL
jgi:hypothetical protein